MKRKRLDARAFLNYHCSLAKKPKIPICGGSPGRMLHADSDNLETSSLEEQQLVSKIIKSNCKEQRMTIEVKSQYDNEDVAKQKDGVSVQRVEQASSSTNADLHEKSLCEMIEGGAADNKRVEQASSSTNADLHEKSLCEMIEGGAADNKVHTSSNDENRVSDGSHGSNKEEMQGESNCSLPRSDELSDLKASSTRFDEYWVPAGFSQLQLEQYCQILVKNSPSLCSSKRGNMSTRQGILNRIKTCCDHPYIVDQSLAKFVNEGRSPADILNAGIEVSGKLVLLDKFLQEAKEKEARVLILFQSHYPHSLQHILDDFICRRFGEESYIHIYREYDSLKKQAELDLFNNDTKSRRFVVLIEKNSCSPSIKLSAVDFVILFNSDSTPANDMKSIQRMSIQSRSDHVKVFRLYLIHSVEEKVLSLAKKDSVLETRRSNFSNTLLLWGTPYLFSRLDDFHSLSSLDNSNSLVEEKLLLDVLNEMSVLMSCQNTNKSGFSLISKYHEGCNDAEDISLYGEKDALHIDDDLPHFTLWISLLEGRNPRWKLLPRSSEIKRRVESEAKDDMPMINKVSGCEMRGESLSVKPGVRKRRSPISRRRRKLLGYSTSGIDGGKSNYSNSVEKACNIRMKKLLSSQKNKIHEFRRTKMEKIAALEEEHQSMVNITSQKYGETTEKQEELKKLDDVYKAKVKELDLQMDRMGAQRASRIKGKQLQNRWLPLSKKKNLVGPITSPSGAPLLNSRPEKQCCSGSEQNMVDGSDFIVVSNGLLTESGVLSGDGSTIMKHSGDNFPGVSVEVNNPLGGSLSPSLESHGENDTTVPSEKVSYTSFKLISVRENHCNAVVRPFNDETENIDAGFDTTSQQLKTKDCVADEQPDHGIQQCPLFAQNCSEPLSTLPNREVQSGENEMEEPHTGVCNSEREGRCALKTASCVLTQPQTCNALHGCYLDPMKVSPEQPMICTTQEMRQTYSPSTTLSTGTTSSCQAVQLQTLLRNIEPSLCHLLPVSQPVAIATTSSQPSITHNLTPNSSCTATSFVRPVLNDYLAGLSSSRPNISPPPTSDPFTNELVRMEMEEVAVMKLHKEQLELLRSARIKEIEKINAKFDLLEQEVGNVLVKKKEDMSSHCQKVRANKMLAETMVVFASTGKAADFKTPLDGNLSSQLHPTRGSGISPRAEHTAPPVQVVRQASGLPSFERINTTGYPWMGYQAIDPAPHFSSYQSISSMPVTHSPLLFHGVPIPVQQNLMYPQNLFLRSCPIGRLSGLMVQHDGSLESSIML